MTSIERAHLLAELGTPTQTQATSALEGVWPVGALFFSAVSTNPATLLGFGTWAAFAAGQVLVGDDGGTYAGGTTGGAATHTHSVSQVAFHVRTDVPGAGATNAYDSGGTVNTPTGAASSFPPYVAVWIWKRTA